MLDKAAGLIYVAVFCRKGRKPDKSVVKKLSFLHPSGDIGTLYRDFQIRRIKVTMVTLLAGLILGCFMKISVSGGKDISSSGFERSEWNGKKQKLELYAIAGGERLEIDITLDPRVLTSEETAGYSAKFRESIWELIRGENNDAQHISGDLILAERYEGYPFKCFWRSSDPKVIAAYGGRVDASSEAEVILSVSYSYADFTESLDIPVRVIRPDLTDGQLLEADLEKYLTEDQRGNLEEKLWKLPSAYEGRELKWELRKEDDSLMITAVFSVLALIIYMASGKDLTDKTVKKKENMKKSYPKILRQLALYIGAGMTVKAAFIRIAEDAPDKSPECIFEEMRIACLEMNRGISETQAYENFGKKTGLSEYIKLSGLLSQNLKRGNPGFAGRLKEEAYSSMHERVLESRKAGEKAQTRLLAPMMMMLAVVMVMIMLPALTGIKI
ncbi:MAG: hypothetical protein K6F65_03050 [Lachnospiraceae bacterium]|nr:hypothetical protein [Lachnospiraceae bacterium]